MHTCNVIASNVGRKAKHVAGEACPSGKVIALGLVDKKLVGCEFFTFEVYRNVITALECADTCGKLTVFDCLRLYHGHNSLLHFKESHLVKFLTFGLMRNI